MRKMQARQGRKVLAPSEPQARAGLPADLLRKLLTSPYSRPKRGFCPTHMYEHSECRPPNAPGRNVPTAVGASSIFCERGLL
jgi:hypothetical protein